MLDFVLTLCCHRNVTSQTLAAIEKFRMKTRLVYYLSQCSGDALIARARSLACTHFLDNNYSEKMVFIDDDVVFEPRHIEKLVKDLDTYDVIGGCYSVRDGTQLASYGWDGKVLMDGSIQEVEYVATGFMGITRKALLKIRDELKLPVLNPNDWARCYPFFESGRYSERKGDPIYISEDWDFCEKARKCGIKVYLDASVQIGHVGNKIYTVQDILQNSRKSRLYDRAATDHLIEHAAEFLKVTPETVYEHIGGDPSKACNDAFTESKLSLGEFYKKGSNYIIYDLIDFNKTYGYVDDRLAPLEKLKGLKILDYGCGIGTASLFLGSENTVYGYDISQQLIDFCNFRKEKVKSNVEFSTKLPEMDFDVIVAIDVFEHIPELKDTLMTFGKMKAGTRIYHRDSFGQPLPIHVDHSREFDQWVKDAGFIKFDEHWLIKV